MQFLKNIQQRLLANVLYKFSLIFCSLYVVLFFSNIKGIKTIFYLFISILLSIGISGLGYVLNDIIDYKNDILNDKQNLFINFSKFQSVCLIILFIIFAIFPWFYLPFNIISFYFLSAEFILFFLYSLPPFRLKEKGIWGITADALYAQVIPCLLAVYTFLKLGEGLTVKVYFTGVYTFWLLVIGIRNILRHQIEDYNNDENTNTKTFVTRYGIERTQKLNLRIIFPIEIILFLCLLLLFSMNIQSYIAFIIYILYVLFLFTVRRRNQENTLRNSTNIDLYTFVNTRILNEFYEIHLPVILLIYFSFSKPFFLLIALLNTLLFLPIYTSYIKGFYNKYIR